MVFKYRTRYWGIVALLCVMNTAWAQQPSTDSTKTTTSKPLRWVTKLSLSSFFTLPASVQGGVEYFFSPRISAQLETGYIYGTLDTYNSLKGIRSRLEGRYYYEGRLERRPKSEWVYAAFIGLDVFHKYTDMQADTYVERYNNAYMQQINLEERKHVIGTTFKTGMQYISPHGVSIEGVVGFGIKWSNFHYTNLPSDATFITERMDMLFVRNPTQHTWNLLPNLYVGFKVGYAI